MSCHGIKSTSSLKLCRNYPKKGSLFCGLHQDISPEEHKRRWIKKFLWGSDGKPFYWRYDEVKKQRILGDLQDRVIQLTKEDIAAIPNDIRNLDIFVFLVENRFASAFDNIPLFVKAIHYLYNYYLLNGNVYTWHLLAKKIVQVLILTNEESLLFFLKQVVEVFKKGHFTNLQQFNTGIPVFGEFLQYLFTCPTGKALSWNPSYSDLPCLYKGVLGKDHPLSIYIEQKFIPHLQNVYKQEKKTQKQKIDSLKEELMAMTWHPDRFQEWCLDEEEKAENRTLFG